MKSYLGGGGQTSLVHRRQLDHVGSNGMITGHLIALSGFVCLHLRTNFNAIVPVSCRDKPMRFWSKVGKLIFFCKIANSQGIEITKSQPFLLHCTITSIVMKIGSRNQKLFWGDQTFPANYTRQ